MKWRRRLVALAVGLGACVTPEPQPVTVVAGQRVALPVQGEFPRIGLQWNYRVDLQGPTRVARVDEPIAMRLIRKVGDGEYEAEWPSPIMKGVSDFGWLNISRANVLLGPPSSFLMRLGVAGPTPQFSFASTEPVTLPLLPVASNGDPMPPMFRRITQLGRRTAIVPAGEFLDCWVAEAHKLLPACETDSAWWKWRARFWWVDRVGMVRMFWWHPDGRRIDLQLAEVRDTKM